VLEYPLNSVKVSNRTIKFELAGDSGGTAFSGMLASDAITGTFAGDMGSGTFIAKRSNGPDFPYISENVRFKSGVVTLAGSLYVPNTRGRHPAVVLLHGSGFETRWGIASSRIG
jgi:poly(3-hydroxybutyrate) depolymerase